MQPQAKVTWSYQKLEEASKYSPLGPSEGRWPCQQPWFKTSGLQNFADHLSCDPQTRFFVPPNIKQWIALLQRGNCTFKEKISRAAFHNAVAVVIYNNKSKEEPVTMTHPGKQKKETVDFVFLLRNDCFIGRNSTSCSNHIISNIIQWLYLFLVLPFLCWDACLFFL